MKDAEFKALISLLEDEDPNIGEHIEQKLLSMGDSIVPRLEKAWEEEKNSIIQGRIEDIIQIIQSSGTIEELREWVESGNGSLLRGWFLISQLQYPDLDYIDYKNIINRITNRIWLELRSGMTVVDKLKAITRMVFDREKYKGDRKKPYDPTRYYLKDVTDKKMGGPISLSLLYLIICLELELNVKGIALPGYFVLTVPGHEENLFIDVFNRGAFFTKKDLQKYLEEVKVKDNPKFYKPASKTDILRELIKTLVICYRHQKNEEKEAEWRKYLDILGLTE